MTVVKLLSPSKAADVIGRQVGYGHYVIVKGKGYVEWRDYDLLRDEIILYRVKDTDFPKLVDILRKRGVIDGKKSASLKRWVDKFIKLRRDKKLMKQINAVIKAARRNPWLKNAMNPTNFEKVSRQKLIKELTSGCWSPGTGFIWGRFAFVEQCSCCQEYAVFYYDPKTGKAFQFESISAGVMGPKGLSEFLSRISKATPKQLKELRY